MRKGEPWTPAEDAILRKDYGTVSASALSKELGRTVQAVRTRAAAIGVAKHRYASQAQRAATTARLSRTRFEYPGKR